MEGDSSITNNLSIGSSMFSRHKRLAAARSLTSSPPKQSASSTSSGVDNDMLLSLIPDLSKSSKQKLGATFDFNTDSDDDDDEDDKKEASIEIERDFSSIETYNNLNSFPIEQRDDAPTPTHLKPTLADASESVDTQEIATSSDHEESKTDSNANNEKQNEDDEDAILSRIRGFSRSGTFARKKQGNGTSAINMTLEEALKPTKRAVDEDYDAKLQPNSDNEDIEDEDSLFVRASTTSAQSSLPLKKILSPQNKGHALDFLSDNEDDISNEKSSTPNTISVQDSDMANDDDEEDVDAPTVQLPRQVCIFGR